MINTESCSLPPHNQDSKIEQLLTPPQTIAVVGMSPNPDRPSHEVALYLKQQGYNVVGIHPSARDIAGIPVYPSLETVPTDFRASIVALFVAGDRTGPIVEQCARVGAKAIYFQPGAENVLTE